MSLSRRRFLGMSVGAAALAGVDRVAGLDAARAVTPIDRKALVTRHNPVLHQLDPLSPLSIGNGEFAFTADITGLQTFS